MSSSTTKADDELNKTVFCQNWNQVQHVIGELKDDISEAWNVGGPQVYKAQLEDNNNVPFKLYITKLNKVFDCDTFYPTEYINHLKCIESSELYEENGTMLQFHTYEKSWWFNFTAV